MNTTTNGTQWRYATIKTNPSLAPVMQRTIVITVYEYDDQYEVTWSDIIGYLTVMETKYSYCCSQGEKAPVEGLTHDEMTALGWTTDGVAVCQVSPVMINSEDCLLEILENKVYDDTSHRIGRRLVQCSWPKTKDREQAELVAWEFIKTAHTDGPFPPSTCIPRGPNR
jgi:hypothetical protein